MAFAWLVGLGLIVISGTLPPDLGLAVILCACVLMGTVLGGFGGDSSGLKDHRQ